MYNREMLKREACKEAYDVWEKRVALLEAKRQNSSLQVNDDEDLLFDKERVVKKPKIEYVFPLNEDPLTSFLPWVTVYASTRQTASLEKCQLRLLLPNHFFVHKTNMLRLRRQ